MLAVVVVLLAAVGLSDGVILNECQVKQQLQNNLVLPSNVPDLMAKIVCHVNLTSNFNTSAVRTINVTEPVRPLEKHENKGSKGSKGRKGRSIGKEVGKKGHPSSSESSKESVENTSDVWTLYGLFQLSDSVACNSTHSPTLNLCKLTCDKLIDNDITDDLACVKILMNKVHTDEDDLHEMFSMMKQEKECANAKNSQYFSHC